MLHMHAFIKQETKGIEAQNGDILTILYMNDTSCERMNEWSRRTNERTKKGIPVQASRE